MLRIVKSNCAYEDRPGRKPEKLQTYFSIENYREGYEQLVDDIVNNPTDMSRIKADLSAIMADYPWILELNHRDLFWRLRQKSALAIVCLIMNEECRNYYLPVWTGEEWDTEHNKDKSDMYAAICSMLEDPKIRAELEEYVHVFHSTANAEWKNIESKGKRYMEV